MKDIYESMASQNILTFYGSKLDLKVDNSELYDYEISKTWSDYSSDVLDFINPINYNSLIIDTNLTDFSSVRDSITLIEYDNRINDLSYVYSGLSTTLSYQSFVNYIGLPYEHTILNNNIYTYTGITNEVHYFKILGFNDEINSDTLTGFSKNIIECSELLGDSVCCPITPKLNNKPWAFKTNKGSGIDNCESIVRRRTEKGWTLDFVFNRDGYDWVDGGIFYYLGVRGDNDSADYADNNLSFGFTSNGGIKWESYRYSGVCNSDSGYTSSYYTSSGVTRSIDICETTDDFNVTIVFERYKEYYNCEIDNDGGYNDLIVGPHAVSYSDSKWEQTDYINRQFIGHSTQIAAGYTITNASDVILSGSIPQYTFVEELNKKWASEKQRRLGKLKIYLNGTPIYKLENWEEIIPSDRGTQPFIQSWGGGTGLMNNLHNGVCSFNIKKIKYFEEPLDFVHVRHHFRNQILPNYTITNCGC
jgi:hypothetical protein